MTSLSMKLLTRASALTVDALTLSASSGPFSLWNYVSKLGEGDVEMVDTCAELEKGKDYWLSQFVMKEKVTAEQAEQNFGYMLKAVSVIEESIGKEENRVDFPAKLRVPDGNIKPAVRGVAEALGKAISGNDRLAKHKDSMRMSVKTFHAEVIDGDAADYKRVIVAGDYALKFSKPHGQTLSDFQGSGDYGILEQYLDQLVHAIMTTRDDARWVVPRLVRVGGILATLEPTVKECTRGGEREETVLKPYQLSNRSFVLPNGIANQPRMETIDIECAKESDTIAGKRAHIYFDGHAKNFVQIKVLAQWGQVLATGGFPKADFEKTWANVYYGYLKNQQLGPLFKGKLTQDMFWNDCMHRRHPDYVTMGLQLREELEKLATYGSAEGELDAEQENLLVSELTAMFPNYQLEKEAREALTSLIPDWKARFGKDIESDAAAGATFSLGKALGFGKPIRQIFAFSRRSQ